MFYYNHIVNWRHRPFFQSTIWPEWQEIETKTHFYMKFENKYINWVYPYLPGPKMVQQTQFHYSFRPGLVVWVAWIDDNPISQGRPNFKIHSGMRKKLGLSRPKLEQDDMALLPATTFM